MHYSNVFSKGQDRNKFVWLQRKEVGSTFRGHRRQACLASSLSLEFVLNFVVTNEFVPH